MCAYKPGERNIVVTQGSLTLVSPNGIFSFTFFSLIYSLGISAPELCDKVPEWKCETIDCPDPPTCSSSSKKTRGSLGGQSDILLTLIFAAPFVPRGLLHSLIDLVSHACKEGETGAQKSLLPVQGPPFGDIVGLTFKDFIYMFYVYMSTL